MLEHFEKYKELIQRLHENFLLPNPGHVKLVRISGEKKKFINVNAELINFEFVGKLNNLQKKRTSP